jgi:hypothetical protein
LRFLYRKTEKQRLIEFESEKALTAGQLVRLTTVFLAFLTVIISIKYSDDLKPRTADSTQLQPTNEFSDPRKIEKTEVKPTGPVRHAYNTKPSEDVQAKKPVARNPKSPPPDSGSYWAWARAQGDRGENEWVQDKRRCVPRKDMPPPCFLPLNERKLEKNIVGERD